MISEKNKKSHEHSTGVHSAIIALAIFLCRISGFVRQRIFGHYLGISDAADIFNTSFRIPNLLQNLFGEGALSSSFIPVYSRLMSEGKKKEADAVAGALISFMSLVVAALVCAGIAAAPMLVRIIAPGFEGAKHEQTIQLVRILFPGAGLLVLSAWCLGILNSHGRFFLSYAAPIVWNGAIIVLLIIAGGSDPYSTIHYASWGSVLGSALQFIVQLPMVISLMGIPRFSLSTKLKSLRTVLKNFIPALMTRGVVQIASFIDAGIASLLGSGAVAIISCAQTIYTLPVSLFGMAVSAAELPAMSRQSHTGSDFTALRERINKALARVAFFVIPSAVALFVLGDVITAALYQTGRFDALSVRFVWGALAGASIGLLASTMGRLYSSAFFALHNTRTPLRFAVIRLSIGAPTCYLLARYAPGFLHVDQQWGCVGITLASGTAGWIEYHLLKHTLGKIIGKTGIAFSHLIKLYAAAIIAAGAAAGIKIFLSLLTHFHPIINGAMIIALFGVVYFTCALMLKIREANALFARIRRITRI
jgi:putative peptidoglycan lipid II flippase